MHVTSKLRFNQTYEKNNARLLRAARRTTLSDPSVTENLSVSTAGQGPMVQPMTYPMVMPLFRPTAGPMGRRMGETTVQRMRYGSANMWAGTPLEKTKLGSPEILLDVEDIFSHWEEVGFRWNLETNHLEAFLTRDGKTYKVKIPVAKVYGLFRAALEREQCNCAKEAAKVGNPFPFYPVSDATLTAIRKDPAFGQARAAAIVAKKPSYVYKGKTYKLAGAKFPNPPLSQSTFELIARDPAFGRAREAAIKAGKKSYVHNGKTYNLPAPPRNCGDFFSWIGCAVEDTGKWVDTAVKDAGRELGKVVDTVGKVALDVVSSPVFAGVMSAISVIPPLSAVGGLGLAASVAANVIKPAMKVVNVVKDVVDAGQKIAAPIIKTVQGVEKVVNQAKAFDVVKTFQANVNTMPAAAQKLMTGALQSTPYTPPKTTPVVRAMSTPSGTTKAVMQLIPSDAKRSVDLVSGLAANVGFKLPAIRFS